MVKALREQGYKQVGSGVFSRVLALPDADTVVKVGGRGTPEHRRKEDEWPHYVDLIKTLGDNKYAPKIHGYRDMGDYYVAEIERFDRTFEQRHRSLLRGGFLDAAEDLLDKYTILLQAVEGLDGQLLRDLDQSDPDLLQIANKIRKSGLTQDIHERNVMVRLDDSLVITDPFY